MKSLEQLFKGEGEYDKDIVDEARRLVMGIQNTFLVSLEGQRTLTYLLGELGYFRSDCTEADTGCRNVASELMRVLSGFDVENHGWALMDSLNKLRIKKED